MPLFLICRTDPQNYDEYFGFVVRARSVEQATKMMKPYPEFRPGHFTVERIPIRGPEEIILEDFNAG